MTVDVARVLQAIPQVHREGLAHTRVRLTEVVIPIGHQHEIRVDRLERGARDRADEARRHLVDVRHQHGIVTVSQHHPQKAGLLVEHLGVERVGRTWRPLEVLHHVAGSHEA